MKLWIDDIRTPPDYENYGHNEWVWCKSVRETINQIRESEYMYNVSRSKEFWIIELIDIDHDAGDYASDGGDYIAILDWLEETGRSYPIHIHSMNPVGVENMRRIIQKNGWTEVN